MKRRKPAPNTPVDMFSPHYQDLDSVAQFEVLALAKYQVARGYRGMLAVLLPEDISSTAQSIITSDLPKFQQLVETYQMEGAQ